MQVDFTNKLRCIVAYLDGIAIPHTNRAKYLGGRETEVERALKEEKSRARIEILKNSRQTIEKMKIFLKWVPLEARNLKTACS